jgi:hypothetical protein
MTTPDMGAPSQTAIMMKTNVAFIEAGRILFEWAGGRANEVT